MVPGRPRGSLADGRASAPSRTDGRMYLYLDAVLVRAPAWDSDGFGLGWPDLTGPDATQPSWRAWLGRAWQVPEIAEAVEAASPDLARQVARISTAADAPEAMVRRTVLSVLRYLLRGTGRATPFGLFAGVAPARIDTRAALRAGTGHQARARVDAAWLASVIETLEASPELLPHLTVVASGLAAERDGHLVIAHRPGSSAGSGPGRVSARATPPVMAALDAARSPLLASALAERLATGFPAAPPAMISRLITTLVREGFLLTGLRAPMTSPDPLAVLTGALDAAGAAGEAETKALRAVSDCLARHDTARDLAGGRAGRHRAAALMTDMHPTGKPPLAVDLRLDWDLTVPEAVAAEAARAAGVLARLARRPVLSTGWAAWHALFLDRYGPGALVPVLDAVDDIAGLGFPAGYLGSPHPVQRSPVAGRDELLLRLAQHAVMRGEREVQLDDALIGELAAAGPGDPVQPSTELTVRVAAASTGDLDEGRFTVHVLGVSRGAGTMAGRFLHLLGDHDRDRMLSIYRDLPGMFRDSLSVQVSAAPLHARSGNVVRAPQAPALAVSLGEHSTPCMRAEIPLSDLAVTADARRLHLVSVSRCCPVHAIMLSAVDLAVHTHPLARFLLEAPVALAVPCTAFDWGAAAALPFVPALRYGRAVISPARWMLAGAGLPGRAAAWPGWDEAFRGWAATARLPRHVYAGDGDRGLPLDLAEPSHRALLRAELDRAGRARLRAAPAPGDLGWADGRPHEITIPLVTAGGGQAQPVRWHGEVTRKAGGHLPGCGGRFYLKLYAPRDLQDTILTRHVPDLAARLGGAPWWFIRYSDPEPHIRLRFTASPAEPGRTAETAAAWTGGLRNAGLLSQVSWETYYPETARFGGASVMEAAEAFFAADSAAAVAQLAASRGKHGPDAAALTAASMADLAVSAAGDGTTAMHWLTSHAGKHPVPPARAVYDQAVALVCEPRDDSDCAMAPVAQAWQVRRAAAAAYRDALGAAGAVSVTDLLPDLLHLHHARAAGPDITAEQACLHLARAAALSWLARTRKAS